MAKLGEFGHQRNYDIMMRIGYIAHRDFFKGFLFIYLLRERETERERQAITYGGQKTVSEALELELHVAVSLLTWVLRVKLSSLERAADALNCRT